MNLTPPSLPRTNQLPIFQQAVEKEPQEIPQQAQEPIQPAQPVTQKPQLEVVPNNVTPFPQQHSPKQYRWVLWLGVAFGITAGLALLLSIKDAPEEPKERSWEDWLTSALGRGDDRNNDDPLDRLLGERQQNRRMSRSDLLEALVGQRTPREPEKQQSNNTLPYPIIINNPGQPPTVVGGQGGGNQS